MHLTAFTDFGLRVLMRLAADPARTFTTDGIARDLGVSRHHLAKVVRGLAAAGFVAARRGTGGGFRLARPAGAITLGAVVRALETDRALVECFRPDGGACALTPGCRLRARLAGAREAFLRELDGTTLAQCAHPPAGRAA
ncbi:MAG: Rrf2 family transcriptional regulator [Geminicoccaceae bacterium]|nr:Rrf2 family transcriptional regulator [Geminicoccaceae bacterium]